MTPDDVKVIVRQYDRTARMCGYRGKLWVENDIENSEIEVNVQIMAMALTSWGTAIPIDELVSEGGELLLSVKFAVCHMNVRACGRVERKLRWVRRVASILRVITISIVHLTPKLAPKPRSDIPRKFAVA